MTEILYTPLEPHKVKVEVLDPTGCVSETHEIIYKAAYEIGRFILTIGGHKYMVRCNGAYIDRLTAEPLKEQYYTPAPPAMPPPRLIKEGEASQLPIATRPAARPFTHEELDSISNWLQSDEGKEKMKELQENWDAGDKIIDKLRDIDPEKLREPFNI